MGYIMCKIVYKDIIAMIYIYIIIIKVFFDGVKVGVLKGDKKYPENKFMYIMYNCT